MRTIFFVVLTLVASAAAAGGRNNTTVSSVVVDRWGIARVTLNGGTEITTPASTCTSNASKLVYDVNGPSGSAWHSMLLTAQTTQRKVNVIGQGGLKCLDLNGTAYEEVATVYIFSP